MKRIIISALVGALSMFLILFGLANYTMHKYAQPSEYTHIDYISEIPQENCYLCGNGSDPIASYYMGQDNIGIVNLNTFDLLYLEINRYDDYGQLIEELAGYMQTSGMPGKDNSVHAFAFPDNGYAQVHIKEAQYQIDKDSVQDRLCQNCLDTVNTLSCSGQAPAEYAVISFCDRMIRPLMRNTPWFAAGNFGVDCEFKENGDIDLLIHYCPVRYE